MRRDELPAHYYHTPASVSRARESRGAGAQQQAGRRDEGENQEPHRPPPGDITSLAWHHFPTVRSPSPSSPPAHRTRRNARMDETTISPDSQKSKIHYLSLFPRNSPYFAFSRCLPPPRFPRPSTTFSASAELHQTSGDSLSARTHTFCWRPLYNPLPPRIYPLSPLFRLSPPLQSSTSSRAHSRPRNALKQGLWSPTCSRSKLRIRAANGRTDDPHFYGLYAAPRF